MFYRTRNCVSEELVAGSHMLYNQPEDWLLRLFKFFKSVTQFKAELFAGSKYRRDVNISSQFQERLEEAELFAGSKYWRDERLEEAELFAGSKYRRDVSDSSEFPGTTGRG
ncbi:hypothetical protein SK128_012722 [Halocaridina rubra]|uniref:Uncharacterized protein n=1 Tax=Halocaridina rubra TaxID=373956 RepID=A0AAN8XU37_HALRR